VASDGSQHEAFARDLGFSPSVQRRERGRSSLSPALLKFVHGRPEAKSEVAKVSPPRDGSPVSGVVESGRIRENSDAFPGTAANSYESGYGIAPNTHASGYGITPNSHESGYKKNISLCPERSLVGAGLVLVLVRLM
jgi:hypothetical protein